MDKLNSIVSIVSTITGNSIESLDTKSSFKNTQNWDSINHVKILLHCESKFNVKIDTELFTDLTSIEKILDHINQA